MHSLSYDNSKGMQINIPKQDREHHTSVNEQIFAENLQNIILLHLCYVSDVSRVYDLVHIYSLWPIKCLKKNKRG